MKICTVCKEEKPISDYYKHSTGSKGQTIYKPACISCTSKKDSERYHKLSKEQKYDRSRSGRKKMGKEYFANYRLASRYGISLENFNSMLHSQNSLCYICGDKFDQVNKAQVDHNHETGEVRKLLCRSCNTALGHMKENVDIMKKAIEYLQEHSH